MTEITIVEDEYDYPGWLVFNGLYKTTVHGDGDISPQDIVEKFSTYTPGSPNNPQMGFEVLDTADKLQQMPELSQETEEFAKGLHVLRFVDEDWVEQWGFDEYGNEEIYFITNHDDVRIYWDYVNDVMMFKGSKQLLEQKHSDLMAAFAGVVDTEQIEFDFDFLLWLLYKQFQDEPLSSDFRIRNATRGSTVAETKDHMGVAPVRDSINVLRSVLLIAPVLSGKKIDSIRGNFLMENYQVVAEIEFGGKVHVHVTDTPLSSLSHLRRMGISLRFLSQLVNLFTGWKRLDPEERYPPPSFFDDMAENAEEEGWGPRFDPEDVKQQYERKRQAAGDGTSNTVPAEDAS